MAQEFNQDAIVSLVRSQQKDASSIDEPEVRQMVRSAVELAGGLSDIVKDGQFVVIKPNLVSVRAVPGSMGPLMMPFAVSDPFDKRQLVPELANGITTDRRVVKAMVELVRELNPSGKVYIMECAGDGTTSENFKRMGYNHENIPGVDAFVAIGEEGDYRDVEADDLVAVDVKNPQYQNLPKFLKNKYYFDKTYYSADAIISLCCLKNHMNAAVTGGIKNVGFGARPAKIYSPKGKTVSAFVIGHFWKPVNAWIHDYYSAKPVDFVLCDGLQGLAWGPSAQGAPSYEAAKMNMRVITASKDPIAHDTIQACIVGVDPEKVDYLKSLAEEGFGTIDTSKIAVVGNARVDEIKKKFPLPDGMLGTLLSGGARKTPYEDYDAPEIAIDDITVKDKTISAKLRTAPKTVKIELRINGTSVGTYTDGFDRLDYTVNGEASKGANQIAFYAYDRFLNAGRQSAEINMG